MKAQKIRRIAAWILGILTGVWVLSLLFPILLPFLIGLGLALCVQKPIGFVVSRLRLPRWAASFVCVLGLLALLAGAAALICRTVCRELSSFLRELPALLSALAEPLSELETKLYSLADRLPDGIGTGLHAGIKSFFASGALLGSKLYETLFTFASGFLGRLPDLLLFVITTVLSAFMFSCELPKLSGWVRKKLPPGWAEKADVFRQRLKTTMGGWLIAQAKLMGVTFLIVTLGLMLLGVRYPLLFALLITVIDALPVFGTGTILIPWSLVSFLRGDSRCGVGFLVLYAAAALTRQTLEPRLVGRQIGLEPVVTLVALYAGYKTVGVLGMVLFPVCAILLKQFYDHAGLQKG